MLSCAQISKSVWASPKSYPSTEPEKRKTPLLTPRAAGLGWEILLDFSGYISRNFPEQGTEGWQMSRNCPGCLQDVWFIIVMYPQLSACRRSCRKYVILLQNKQGTLKAHYWPKAGSRTKPNIIQVCRKGLDLGKSGGFSFRLLVWTLPGPVIMKKTCLLNDQQFMRNCKGYQQEKEACAPRCKSFSDAPGNINRWWQSNIKQRWLLTCRFWVRASAVTAHGDREARQRPEKQWCWFWCWLLDQATFVTQGKHETAQGRFSSSGK